MPAFDRGWEWTYTLYPALQRLRLHPSASRLEMLGLLLAAAPLAAAGPPIPTPGWQPTYNMSLSTVFMPCNYSGMFDGQLAGQWGIAGTPCVPPCRAPAIQTSAAADRPNAA